MYKSQIKWVGVIAQNRVLKASNNTAAIPIFTLYYNRLSGYRIDKEIYTAGSLYTAQPISLSNTVKSRDA